MLGPTGPCPAPIDPPHCQVVYMRPTRLPAYLEPCLRTGAQAILCRSHKVAWRAYSADAPHAHRAAPRAVAGRRDSLQVHT